MDDLAPALESGIGLLFGSCFDAEDIINKHNQSLSQAESLVKEMLGID